MTEVFIDGASAGNPGLSGAGIFIKHAGNVQSFEIELGMMTNNEAEFHALIKALEICQQANFTSIQMKSDSTEVVGAIDKKYTKNEAQRKLLHTALQLIETFDLFLIDWIPSKQNRAADHLARQAIWKQKKQK